MNNSFTFKSGGPSEASRRDFLRRSGQIALTGTALPFALNLAALGDAAAADATDYRALVCVFLGGGNDYANTVVTYDDASYNKYYAIRSGSGIAIDKTALAATLLTPTVPLPDNRQYALHPVMTSLAGLFNSGKAAVQLNVGPLVVPLTRAQYSGKTQPFPPKLMSHNDQQSIWQSSAPEGSSSGWGGRMADLSLAANGNSMFTCISSAGNAIFVSGRDTVEYRIGTSGALPITAIKTNPNGLPTVRAALNTLIQQPRTHLLEDEYIRVTRRSIQAEILVSAALGGNVLTTQFPANNPLADQLKIIARLISSRSALGSIKRQVFFASTGSFDHHDNLTQRHPPLLYQLSEALTAFYNAMAEIGMSQQVTAFTASDFGRTMTPNGNGSDHGWGSHHFVVGGAVKGQAFYGTAPPVSVNNTSAPEDQWHIGSGRLLPTTSVDQYAATLARWFGVPDADLDGVLPNLKNFNTAAYPRDMGFMGTPT